MRSLHSATSTEGVRAACGEAVVEGPVANPTQRVGRLALCALLLIAHCLVTQQRFPAQCFLVRPLSPAPGVGRLLISKMTHIERTDGVQRAER